MCEVPQLRRADGLAGEGMLSRPTETIERSPPTTKETRAARTSAPSQTDRIEPSVSRTRDIESHARRVPYLSVSFDLGFLAGVQVGATLAEGRLYSSIGVFSGAVPGVGVSLEAGVVVPNAGRTIEDVVAGTSVNASAGAVAGMQTSFGSAGYQLGAGLTTPSFGVGIAKTYGRHQ
ncbi:MAG: hypothetical protein NVS2B3_04350 [Vulcanimicrobiaceae bacterium]